VTQSYRAALAAFLEEGGTGWTALSFFGDGSADVIAGALDQEAVRGTKVLPAPGDIFNALRLTPLSAVRAVILGQDPYPTPGDAHGLAFSVNSGVAIPRSLGNIFKELESDIGLTRPGHGQLQRWAEQGVLLLNTCLSVRVGEAGSHRKLGWQTLTDQVIGAASDRQRPVVFMLWGADAQAKRSLIASHHLIIESAHPSPLSARRGFFGSRPFSRANDFLRENGLDQIDWRLD
jgi:uracil-DNA glycosylase